MNRVTVEQVREAYRRTGHLPLRGKWEDDGACCPLLACALDKTGPGPQFGMGNEMRFVATVLELDPSYALGFVRALDHDYKEGDPDGQTPYAVGIRDGYGVAKALFHVKDAKVNS